MLRLSQGNISFTRQSLVIFSLHYTYDLPTKSLFILLFLKTLPYSNNIPVYITHTGKSCFLKRMYTKMSSVTTEYVLFERSQCLDGSMLICISGKRGHLLRAFGCFSTFPMLCMCCSVA